MNQSKPKLNAKQVHLFMQAATVAGILAIFGFTYLANSLLGKQADKVKAAHVQAAVAEQKQQQIAKAKADIFKYKDLAAIAKNIVPQDKDQAQTVREVTAMAEASGIRLGSITFPTSSLGTTGGAAKAGLSQLTPNPAAPGLYSLDITIQSDPSTLPSFAKFMEFLKSIEQNRRTALVKSVSIQPDVTNPTNISFTLTVTENIKP